MNKKALLALIIGLTLTAMAMADAPKVGMEFKQQMDMSWVDNKISGAQFAGGTDGAYSRTEIKGKVGFKFGSYSMTPWIKDRFEVRLNPGDIEGDGDLTVLGKLRFRNRFYFGIENSYKIIDPLTILFNLELRVANDMRSDKTQNDGNAIAQVRFSPQIGISGSVSGLYYTATEYFHIYFQEVGVSGVSDYDDASKIRTELEGYYNIGYKLKLSDSMSVKFDVEDTLGFYLGTSDSDDEKMYSYLQARVIFGLGDVSPYIGFINDFDKSNDTTVNNLMGATIGADLKKENWSFGTAFKFAKDLENDNIQTYMTASVKIKI